MTISEDEVADQLKQQEVEQILSTLRGGEIKSRKKRNPNEKKIKSGPKRQQILTLRREGQ